MNPAFKAGALKPAATDRHSRPAVRKYAMQIAIVFVAICHLGVLLVGSP